MHTWAGLVLLAAWCLGSLWGCAHVVVEPAPQEHSAIAFAQRVLRDMSTGLEKLRASMGTTVQDQGTYRILACDFFPHDVATAQMMQNFTRFCTHLGGTMVQSACQASAAEAEQVKFVVRIENQSPKEFVRLHVTVYEPIGPPSAAFLRATVPYR